MDSILTSVKKLLGLESDYTQFDTDIIIAINSALMVLNQLGVGVVTDFKITDASETWSDYLGEDSNIEGVKTYVYLKVRLIFDPPTSSFVVDSIERLINEYAWRIQIQVEGSEA